MPIASSLSTTSRGSGPAGEVSPEFERGCVEFFADVVQVLGVPSSVGQIYGLLFASLRPQSFTDIVERLAISKGSASQGLQLLRSLGAVQSMNVAGSRRELFVPELGLRKLVSGVLREKVEPMMAGGGRLYRLRACAQKTPHGPAAKFSLDRVKQIETWRRQMGLLLPVMRTFLGSGSA